jgi:hypothetical protein
MRLQKSKMLKNAVRGVDGYVTLKAHIIINLLKTYSHYEKHYQLDYI